MQILIIDMGGTYVKWTLAEKTPNNLKFLEKGKFFTFDRNEESDGRIVIKKIALFAEKMRRTHNIKCVCSTAVGAINPHGVVLSPNHTLKNYEGLNLKKEFNKYCKLPIHFMNDVKAAAQGELSYGWLKGKKNVNAIVMAIGTGIAGCPIINSKVYFGSTYASGECGQMVVNGHFYEQHYSTRALIERCREVLPSIKSAEECLERVKKNKKIKLIVDAWFVGLVEGIMAYIYLFNPSYFIFGGGITEHEYFNHVLLKKILLKLARKPVSSFEHVEILKTKLGNDAALYGVASLAKTK